MAEPIIVLAEWASAGILIAQNAWAWALQLNPALLAGGIILIGVFLLFHNYSYALLEWMIGNVGIVAAISFFMLVYFIVLNG